MSVELIIGASAVFSIIMAIFALLGSYVGSRITSTKIVTETKKDIEQLGKNGERREKAINDLFESENRFVEKESCKERRGEIVKSIDTMNVIMSGQFKSMDEKLTVIIGKL